MPLGRIVGLLAITLVLGIVFFNGVVMLASPARWFTLPRYIALRGTLREHDYLRTRFGRLEIRTVGLMFAGVTGWVIGSFFGIPQALRSGNLGNVSFGVPIDWWLCVATCVFAIGCGVVMLLKPKWWIAKYFGTGYGGTYQTALERALRILGLIVIGIGIYFLLQCMAVR